MPKQQRFPNLRRCIAISRTSRAWLRQILIVLLLAAAQVGMSPPQAAAASPQAGPLPPLDAAASPQAGPLPPLDAAGTASRPRTVDSPTAPLDVAGTASRPLAPLDAAGATTFYVDNTNPACSNAGPGTRAQPFCAIQQGSDRANTPGDTVNVLRGSYAETVFAHHSGAEGSPITFHGEPGVTVTGSPTGFGSGFAASTVQYLVIDGFTITQTKNAGIYVDTADHITISHNHVTYAGKDGGVYSHKSGIHLHNTSSSIVTNNITDHNSCIGIRLVNVSNNNLVSRNISFGNSSTIAYPEVLVSDAAGIELTGSSENTVINNITYSNEDSGINVYVLDNGQVFLPSAYNLIAGNLNYGNGDHGIDANNSPYTTITGNTVQGNGTVGINLEGNTPDTGSHHAMVMNNISVENGFTPPANSFGGNLRVDSNSIAGTVLDYNLFDRQSAADQIIWGKTSYPSLAAFQADAPAQEIHGLEGKAYFTNSVLPVLRSNGDNYLISVVEGDYRLTPDSLAIDSANADAPGEQQSDIAGAGRVDDLARPDTGAGVRTFDDRGAYEFQPVIIFLPAVLNRR